MIFTTQKIKRFLEEGFDPLGEVMEEELKDSSVPAPLPEKSPSPRKDRHLTVKTTERLRLYASVLLCGLLIVLVSVTMTNLPDFATSEAMRDSEVARFYSEHSLEDTGALNIISAIILSYRGFDTLGESHVLFISVCLVILLLKVSPTDKSAGLAAYRYHDYREEPHDDEILRAGCRVVVPLIIMFGIYIVLNGNLSPGGGFSGGAVISAGLILFLSVYGYKPIRRFMTWNVFRAVTTLALTLYSCFKCYHFVTGAGGFESIFGTGTPGSIFSGGMLLFLNIFVGMTVACAMYGIFTLFRRGDF